METLINNWHTKTYCQKYGLFCEAANENGYCKMSACSRRLTDFAEDKQLRTNFRIVHRKDGVYDLYDGIRWIMSRGCIDDILNFLSTTSKYSAIRIVFEDESLKVDNNEKTS